MTIQMLLYVLYAEYCTASVDWLAWYESYSSTDTSQSRTEESVAYARRDFSSTLYPWARTMADQGGEIFLF